MLISFTFEGLRGVAGLFKAELKFYTDYIPLQILTWHHVADLVTFAHKPFSLFTKLGPTVGVIVTICITFTVPPLGTFYKGAALVLLDTASAVLFFLWLFETLLLQNLIPQGA